MKQIYIKVKNRINETNLKKAIQNTVGNLGDYTIDKNGNVTYILDINKINKKFKNQEEIVISLPSVIHINLKLKSMNKKISGLLSIKYIFKNATFNKPVKLESKNSEIDIFVCRFYDETLLKSLDSKLNIGSCYFSKNINIIDTKQLNINVGTGFYMMCDKNLNIEVNELNVGNAIVNLNGDENIIKTKKTRISGIINCLKKIDIDASELELISASNYSKLNISSPIIIYNGENISKREKTSEEKVDLVPSIENIKDNEQTNSNKFVKVLK